MGRIWLTEPVVWHTSHAFSTEYDPDSGLTSAQFQLIHEKWHNWYTADWDYAQTTIIFLCSGIACLTLLNAIYWLRRNVSKALESAKVSPSIFDRLVAIGRFTLAVQYRIQRFNWYSPPLAAIIGVAGMFTFLMSLTFAARPYYWPNMAMGDSQPIATRTGWISIAIMPFMIAFATKVNWIALITGTSHEKLQVFHRWSAVFMYITSLIHTFPFIVKSIAMGEMEENWNTTQPYWTGVAALVPQTYLMLMSWEYFRNPYYEFFKKLHFIAASIFMIFLFIHVNYTLSSWDYFWATAAIYFLAYFTRIIRTLYNSGIGLPATVELISHNMLKLTVHASPRFKWTPGQHVFIRFLNLGIHTFSSHPLTIASLSGDGEIEMVFKVHGGITKALAKRVEGKPACSVGRVWVDGPYGGVPASLKTFDNVYLFAGGSGASFTIPLLLELVQDFHAEGQIRCKHIEFVLAVRDIDTISWLETSLAKAKERGIKIQVHVTQTTSSALKDDKLEDESQTDLQKELSFFIGRPNLPHIVNEACRTKNGTIAVVACGPDSLLYDVRNAVGECQLAIADGYGACSDLFLHTENYGW